MVAVNCNFKTGMNVIRDEICLDGGSCKDDDKGILFLLLSMVMRYESVPMIEHDY